MVEIGSKYIGRSVARREDKRLLRGEGTFVGDMKIQGMLHVGIVRSQLPHAYIKSVNLSAASALDGVHIALSGKDLKDELPPISGMQVSAPQGWRDGMEPSIEIPDQNLLPHDKVRFVGEPYALVVADNRYTAEDAIELIDAKFDPLQPINDAQTALNRDAGLIHETLGQNIAATLHAKKGDGAAAIERAQKRLKRKFFHHRYAGMPLECRGVLADYDSRTDSLTVWSSTQVVHWVRREISAALKMPEERIRVIAPDVGGGFGVKGHVYPEDILIAYLAKRLCRPIKWLEDRHEHFLNSAHSRDNHFDIEVGFNNDGRIVALKNSFLIDSGAYSPVGAAIGGNSIVHTLGPYDIDHYEAYCKLMLTNRTPNAPYRGAGRPEVAFVMERVVDLVANELDLDPADVRLKNMIQPEQMPYNVGLPYRDGVIIEYDGGDYPKALRMALEDLGGLADFRSRQKQALEKGSYLGLGIGCYVEGTGIGPFEGATVKIDSSGKIFVKTGACPQGQGHETTFAQVAADLWGVPIEDVFVTLADTAQVTMGYGTMASRSAVTASGAIQSSSAKLQDKVLRIAAHVLEVPEADLEFRDGKVSVKGVAELSITLKEIATAAQPGWNHQRPEGVQAGLEETAYYEPPTVTWAYAANAAIVEVDVTTGEIHIERYVEVHDAGNLINPAIADGQVKGGLVQGLGGALMEELCYDEHGQLMTGSFMDYLIPTASDVPPIKVIHLETPSTRNVFGFKGLGEGGAIAPPVVIANAVCDALKPFKIELNNTPVKCQDIVRLVDNSSINTNSGS